AAALADGALEQRGNAREQVRPDVRKRRFFSGAGAGGGDQRLEILGAGERLVRLRVRRRLRAQLVAGRAQDVAQDARLLRAGRATPVCARGCTGERIAPSRGLDIAVDRGRTACAAAIGRICCPVARATLATGGPKLPLRETVAFGPVRGRVCVTTPYVRRD